MEKWSIVKRFRKVSHKDFLNATEAFCKAIHWEHHEESLKVSITFYKEMPHSVSGPEEGILEWVEKENTEKELTRKFGVGGTPYFPRELFEASVNIQVDVEVDTLGFVGKMECKGLQPRHMVFLIWDDNKPTVKKVMLEKLAFSRWAWREGNGEELLHSCSVS